jgi:hypothetical protein
MGWGSHIARAGDIRNEHKVITGKKI